MKLELKKIKFGPGSRETTQFTAELYCDGKLVADVSNDGGGGPHMHYPVEGMRKKLDEIEQYAIKQDPKGFEQLDGLINDMLTNHEIKKLMAKGIVTGMPGKPETIRVAKFNKSIKDIMTSEANRMQLKVHLLQLKKRLQPGEIIMNTNLGDLI